MSRSRSESTLSTLLSQRERGEILFCLPRRNAAVRTNHSASSARATAMGGSFRLTKEASFRKRIFSRSWLRRRLRGGASNDSLPARNAQAQHHAARQHLLELASAVCEACEGESLHEVGERVRHLERAYQEVHNVLLCPLTPSTSSSPTSPTSRRPPPTKAPLSSGVEEPARAEALAEPAVERSSGSAPRSRLSINPSAARTAGGRSVLSLLAVQARDASTESENDVELVQGVEPAPTMQSALAEDTTVDATPRSPKPPPQSALVQHRWSSQTSTPDASPVPALSSSSHGLEELSPQGLGHAQLYQPGPGAPTAFLIDLDGTMYDPAGLLQGASARHSVLSRPTRPLVRYRAPPRSKHSGSHGCGATQVHCRSIRGSSPAGRRTSSSQTRARRTVPPCSASLHRLPTSCPIPSPSRTS